MQRNVLVKLQMLCYRHMLKCKMDMETNVINRKRIKTYGERNNQIQMNIIDMNKVHLLSKNYNGIFHCIIMNFDGCQFWESLMNIGSCFCNDLKLICSLLCLISFQDVHSVVYIYEWVWSNATMFNSITFCLCKLQSFPFNSINFKRFFTLSHHIYSISLSNTFTLLLFHLFFFVSIVYLSIFSNNNLHNILFIFTFFYYNNICNIFILSLLYWSHLVSTNIPIVHFVFAFICFLCFHIMVSKNTIYLVCVFDVIYAK